MKNIRKTISTFVCVLLSTCAVTALADNLFSSIKGGGGDDAAAAAAILQQMGIDVESAAGLVSVRIDDPNYEWSQFDSKAGKCMIDKNGNLTLESKTDNQSVVTTTELNIDTESDFDLMLSLLAKPENGKNVGIVFDYENNRNYKAFIVNKKEFVYYVVEKGEVSIVKQGLVKPGKLISSLGFHKTGDKLTMMLNGVEVTTLKKVPLATPNFGLIVNGKYKVVLCGFTFRLDIPDDEEQPTTDN